MSFSRPSFLPLPSDTSGGHGQPPPYQEPLLLHTYSHLADRSYADGNDSMTYFKMPPLPCDLNRRYEQRLERDLEKPEHLDALCESLLRVTRRRSEQGDGSVMGRGSIITWRGMLTKLLTATYETRDGWEMTVQVFNGDVYLEEYQTSEQKRQKVADQSPMNRQTYYGYAFESYATTPLPNANNVNETGWSGDVDTNVQWGCVVKSRIGATPLIMAGEVDCVEGQWKKTTRDCVELKTNMVLATPKQGSIFERKLLKHWAQSYLLGVPTVFVGFRNNEGWLQEVRRFETRELPNMVGQQSGQKPWSASVCLATLDRIAAFVVENALSADESTASTNGDGRSPPTVFRLQFEPKRGFTLRRIDESQLQFDTTKDSVERWGFLPVHYVKQMDALLS